MNFFDGLENDLDAQGVDVQASEYAPTEYRENCTKCRNGQFISYSGRAVGRCFACKGVGYHVRKTSPEFRAKVALQKVVKKAKSDVDTLEAFKAAQPEAHDWLIRLNGQNDFASSLFRNLLKYGQLTDNQLASVLRSIEKTKASKEAAIQRVANAPTVQTDKLMEAFNNATKNGLGRPKLRFETFQASLAPVHGANSGAVYIKSGEQYLGKVKEGRFIASRECTADQIEDVTKTMENPVAAAIAYGRRIGSCSCCGRTLTDKVSVENGIGPICAEKFGF
jgi:hypothetical protein